MSDTIHCTIYRSRRKEEYYLYLAEGKELEELPKAVLEGFGPPDKAMELDLDENRTLARVDVKKVLQHLKEDGFYIQIPPNPIVEREILDKIAK